MIQLFLRIIRWYKLHEIHVNHLLPYAVGCLVGIPLVVVVLKQAVN
jgi:hypothetical protein